MVPARGKTLVKTDLQIAIPAGTYARVGAYLHSQMLSHTAQSTSRSCSVALGMEDN